MAIEIYDSAKIVEKNGIYYYLLKNGSKNTTTCPYQYVIDNNFDRKFLRKETRSSSWKVVAIGNKEAVEKNLIANTKYNCPQAYMYGEIRFGNGKNIARYYVGLHYHNKILKYEELTHSQQLNFNQILSWAEDNHRKIDLNNIKDEQKTFTEYEYGNEKMSLETSHSFYKGIKFWDNSFF